MNTRIWSQNSSGLSKKRPRLIYAESCLQTNQDRKVGEMNRMHALGVLVEYLVDLF